MCLELMLVHDLRLMLTCCCMQDAMANGSYTHTCVSDMPPSAAQAAPPIAVQGSPVMAVVLPDADGQRLAPNESATAQSLTLTASEMVIQAAVLSPLLLQTEVDVPDVPANESAKLDLVTETSLV